MQFSTKTITINKAATADAGTAISICSTQTGVDITTGASATNNVSVAWTSTGTAGTLTNASSLAGCTYYAKCNRHY